MSRTFGQKRCPVVRAGLTPADMARRDRERWGEFANAALHYVTTGMTARERVLGLLKLSRTLTVIGEPGGLNACVRLREEVERMLFPPRPYGRMAAGVDIDALTATNRDEVERFARAVLTMTTGPP